MKYKIFTTALMGAALLSGAALWAQSPPPPPPPPPPVEKTVQTTAQNLMSQAQAVLKNHDVYAKALEAYLEAAKTNPNAPRTALDTAATNLGNSLAAVQRYANNLAKELPGPTGPTGSETSMTQTAISKSKLPAKTQEALMDELRQKLQARGIGSTDASGDASAPAAPASSGASQ